MAGNLPFPRAVIGALNPIRSLLAYNTTYENARADLKEVVSSEPMR